MNQDTGGSPEYDRPWDGPVVVGIQSSAAGRATTLGVNLRVAV
jgi:hypothetical protein